jgi:hypothetical protein
LKFHKQLTDNPLENEIVLGAGKAPQLLLAPSAVIVGKAAD